MYSGYVLLGLQLTRALVVGLISVSIAQAQPSPVTITVRLDSPQQTIDNFGGSGCWFSEGIGRYWPQSSKDSIARFLFSKETGPGNQLKGIGLSAWRFNIGGGTAEQGIQSGIKTSVKRIECFLTEDGRYDWTKQSGYQWFLRKANEYKVENLIAFSNTPPVFFTKNQLGFKTEKDYICNLRDDKYDDYAGFLSKVLKHFDSTGLHFKYVSPVNEPQWDWSNKFGQMNQEGTPWSNGDIYRIAKTLDSSLKDNKLTTKILLPEAATLKHIYTELGQSARQAQAFFGSTGNNVKSLSTVHPIIAGHSYFTDAGDSNRINIRKHLRDTLAKYNAPFWQSEYSMLGNGYKENKPGRIPAMDCALFLAKMIHTDLTVANATAWQLWNVYEPGSAEFDTRYYLIALQTNDSNTSGTFEVTKNLWAMGHFSRFIRPGMTRVAVERDDYVSEYRSAQDLMVSAYTDSAGRSVIVLINYSQDSKSVNIRFSTDLPPNASMKKKRKQALSDKNKARRPQNTLYFTTSAAGEDMKPMTVGNMSEVQLQPRSINTIVTDK